MLWENEIHMKLLEAKFFWTLFGCCDTRRGIQFINLFSLRYIKGDTWRIMHAYCSFQFTPASLFHHPPLHINSFLLPFYFLFSEKCLPSTTTPLQRSQIRSSGWIRKAEKGRGLKRDVPVFLPLSICGNSMLEPKICVDRATTPMTRYSKRSTTTF